MKILLINPALRPSSALKLFPVGLAYVATAIRRAGFEFDLLDLDATRQPPEETERFLRTHRYDVVGMGCVVTGYKYVKWLSSVIKNAFPNTVVVAGNSVASSIHETLFRCTEVDIAVIGEGDETIVELLDSLQSSRNLGSVRGIYFKESGEIRKNPPRPLIDDINSIPYPDWTLFDTETYIQSLARSLHEPLPPIPPEEIRPMPINTARGCPFKCTFCYHVFRDSKYRWRSPESVVQEMKEVNDRYGVNYVTFHDELTFHSIRQADTFAEALLSSGLQMYWKADVRSGLFTKEEHVETARKLKRAGALSLSFSLESANPDILKWMDKKVGVEAFSRQVEILRKADIASVTSIVIGYPSETESTIKSTIDCCIDNYIYPSAGYLLPQPGTPMYDYAVEHGYIKDEEEYLLRIGDRQDLHLNMTQMTNYEMETITQRELARCSRELGLDLQEGGLLKTGHYRVPTRHAH